MNDTIFALSSGAPPAGIAIVRISGAAAGRTFKLLTGRQLPKPRTATLRLLTDPRNDRPLDQALTFFFPGPLSATGEDVLELHLHGGRAVVTAVLDALSHIDGLRQANAGEFTRRAFETGRIDLATAEGLADLLAAETEAQRRAAIAQVRGSLHRLIEDWATRLLRVSAKIEAAIDFSDEDDVQSSSFVDLHPVVQQLGIEIRRNLTNPPAERLHSGIRVAIIGPPNAGKSTLLNRLIGREAAIVSVVPGTTRDAIEAYVKLRDVPLIFVDTAGIRLMTDDPVEKIGIERSRQESLTADIILALGGWDEVVSDGIVIHVAAKSDLLKGEPGIPVSAKTGQGMSQLIDAIIDATRSILPAEGEIAFNARHRTFLAEALAELDQTAPLSDELLIAEHLRLARRALAKVVGGTDTEAMLDILFGAFCIGK